MLRTRDSQQQQQAKQQPYVCYNPDLAQILDGEEGTFEVVQGNQAFTVTTQAGHSITSLIPSGQKLLWVVTPIQNAESATIAEEQQRGNSRAARA